MGNEKYILIVLFLLNSLFGQFGEVTVVFDDHLLRDTERQFLYPLKEDIKRFLTTTVWNSEYDDLNIPLHIQFIFEGTATKGSVETYLAQTLVTNGSDQRYFDTALQFFYNAGSSLYYDPVRFDPLTSFLAYYAFLVLAMEIDTYEPNGGTSVFEQCRAIALRGIASDYTQGWDDRLQEVDLLVSNSGLRKARYAYYYAMELVADGELEYAVEQFQQMIAGLNEVYDRSPREHYTVLFLGAHAKDLARVLGKLRQKTLLENLMDLDRDNESLYAEVLRSISP